MRVNVSSRSTSMKLHTHTECISYSRREIAKTPTHKHTHTNRYSQASIISMLQYVCVPFCVRVFRMCVCVCELQEHIYIHAVFAAAASWWPLKSCFVRDVQVCVHERTQSHTCRHTLCWQISSNKQLQHGIRRRCCVAFASDSIQCGRVVTKNRILHQAESSSRTTQIYF